MGLGPSGVILGNTLLDRFRVKGTSSEGKTYAFMYNNCVMIFQCIRTSPRATLECYSGRGLRLFFFDENAYGACTGKLNP